ncbi:MAG TPA: carboxymuconolactone decarboxylase family protein [Castellaniella sp.]|uniref:carboxymuconolactone decarboxylase family protein n=1 Tax=Castellaniella sp. TaxID=1955812 RepID=UPI002F0DBA36
MTHRLNYREVIPQGAKALGTVHQYLDNCGLPQLLIDLVYLRVSLINGCAYCIDLHTRDLMKGGMSIEKIVLVPVWEESDDLFDRRERAALAWAESLTRVSETHAPDADYDAVEAVFSDKELADLTLAISVMNAYNRLGIGFRNTPKAVANLHASVTA